MITIIVAIDILSEGSPAEPEGPRNHRRNSP